MEMEGTIDEVFQRFRFNPSPTDAVTYYLPCLISGEPTPHGAERLVHRADVYACEPRDLAAAFAPVPRSAPSDDRFFFTLCRRLKGRAKKSARAAGAGTWVSQSTRDIKDVSGVKVGEIKKLCFMLKGKVTTGWLMEEYRCCLQEAVFADGDLVMCKIYLSPNAGAAARQESAAYLRRQEAAEPVLAPAPRPEPVSAHDAPKRPAPVAADPPCPKRTRVAVPVPTAPPVVQVQQGYSASAVFAAPPPAAPALPEAPAAAEEADGDMGPFTCTFDELFGVCEAAEEKEESENEVDQFASSLECILGWEEEEEEEEGTRTLPADDDKGEEEAYDQQAVFAMPILNLDDIPSFTLDDLDMPPADHGEQPEQQAVFTSGDESAMAAEEEFKELLGRYKPRPMFTLDQLEGHKEFFSYAG